jgi:hypothetical protein
MIKAIFPLRIHLAVLMLLITGLAGCGSPDLTPTGSGTTGPSSTSTLPPYVPRDDELTATAHAVDRTSIPITSTAVMEGAADVEGFPLAFPLPVPDAGQIAEARACDVHMLYTARYQEVALDALPGVAPPQTACDWAALAFAYGFRFKPGEGKSFPEAGDRAFFTAIEGNQAMMYLGTLSQHYLLAGGVVSAPAQAAGPLSAIVITGDFNTPDATAHLDMTISEPGTAAPTVSGNFRLQQVQITASGTPAIQVADKPLAGPVEAGPVMGLANALTDLVPVSAVLPPTQCGGIDAQWLIEYRYASGAVITVQGTTLWQTSIDGQQYLQYGPGLPVALNVLFEKLEIPIKAGAGTYCLDVNLIDLAFPRG